MKRCQCEGIEELFDQKFVSNELQRYRKKGPIKTTRMLIDALKKEGVGELTLLDIGGGVGLIQRELLAAGAQKATSVDASTAYVAAAKAEAEKNGYADRVSYIQGDFVDLDEEIDNADIVTLDRVICCYDDMQNLVSLSAGHARRLYGVVYPRDVWWVKVLLAVENLGEQFRRSNFRAFVHSSDDVEALVVGNGLKRHSYQRTLTWQVVVYGR